MPKKKLKYVPRFKTEDEEREFWSKNDFTDYLHQFKPVKLDLTKLKPSTKPITIRLPESLIDSLKKLANKRDVPYQSMMKIFLDERVRQEFRSI